MKTNQINKTTHMPHPSKSRTHTHPKYQTNNEDNMKKSILSSPKKKVELELTHSTSFTIYFPSFQ